MSNNAKPTAESSTPSETVEEDIKPTSENGIEEEEEAGKKVKQNVHKKENKAVKKDVQENGTNDSPYPAKKQKKRKFLYIQSYLKQCGSYLSLPWGANICF